MKLNRVKLLFPIFALSACLLVFHKWTLGFTSFTVYSHTLNKSGISNRDWPDFEYVDQDGTSFKISEKSGFVLINFIYLDCPDVCHVITNRLDNIHKIIDQDLTPGRIEFVTISFDLENDSRERLKTYRSQFGTQISGWSFGLPADFRQETFLPMLEKTGIWARKRPGTDLINHSLFIFLISPELKVVEVFDPARDSDSEIISRTLSWLKGTENES